MTKKEYIAPEMECIAIKAENCLLTMSRTLSDTEVDDSTKFEW